MKIASLVTLAACWLPSQQALAQFAEDTPQPDSRWAISFGGPTRYERLIDLAPAADGSIIVAALTNETGFPSEYGWLLRLDPCSGGILSQNTLWTPGGYVGGASLSADGGALFVGSYAQSLYDHDAWVVRVDATGSPLWWRGLSSPADRWLLLEHAVESASGGWYAAGVAGIGDAGGSWAWLLKLSPSGALDWQFDYNGGGSETFLSLAATADGGVVAAGSRYSTGDEDALVVKLDASGAITWQRTFGGAEHDRAIDIVELQSGGFAVVGSARSFTSPNDAPWVLRLNARGDLVWHAVVDAYAGGFSSVAETSDGGFVALGNVLEHGFPTLDWLAMEFNGAGDVCWQRAYDGDADDLASSVLALPPTGFVFGGTLRWNQRDCLVVRTTPDGRLPGCSLDRATNFALLHPPLVEQDVAVALQAADNLDQTFSFEHGTSSVVDVRLCH